jgi:hypothetical protein
LSTKNLALPCAALLIIVVCSVHQNKNRMWQKREEKKVVDEEEDGRLSLYNDGNVATITALCNHYDNNTAVLPCACDDSTIMT